jgi:predicted short-subunit dehydrogenase-like oxidoreductase (DUF2520 family)
MATRIPATLVIGAGRAGLALATAIRSAGGEARVMSRSTAGADRARARGLALGAPTDAAALWIIAVPDDAVATVAAALAGDAADQLPATALHLAGSVSADALAPLAARGVRTGTMHPLHTLTADPASAALDGAPAAVSGVAADTASDIARALGMRPFALDDAMRARYHAAAALAANGTVTLLDAAVAAAERAGMPAELARSGLARLASAAAARVAAEGAESALTGPIRRGDAGTVRRHLEALASDAETVALYRDIGLRTVALAERAGLATSSAATLRDLLHGDAK